MTTEIVAAGPDVRLPPGVTESLRVNHEMEAVVRHGVLIASLVDFRSGADHMRVRGVPMHVAMRVLLHPELRRATDWKH
jgi:hypothetical protein